MVNFKYILLLISITLLAYYLIFQNDFLYWGNGQCIDLIRVIDNQGGGPNEYLTLGEIDINITSKELIIADAKYP